jgi:hypothetical protein
MLYGISMKRRYFHGKIDKWVDVFKVLAYEDTIKSESTNCPIQDELIWDL